MQFWHEGRSLAFRKSKLSKTIGRRKLFCASLCKGDTLIRPGLLAIIMGIVGAWLEYVLLHDWLGLGKHFHWWTVGFKGFKVFSTLVGFLVLFKNSQAYYNYWNACKLMQNLNGSLFNSFSSCISFSRKSKADDDALADYRLSISTFYSLMSAACYYRLLCNVADRSQSELTDEAYSFHVIGMQALSEVHLDALSSTHCCPSLILHWIQACVIEHIDLEVLTLHPALVSRIYFNLHKAYMAYEELMKFVSYPFPVSYSAAALWVMAIHAWATPLAVVTVVGNPLTAFILTFCLVFVYHVLYLQSLSLSNPFEADELNLEEIMKLQNSKYCMVLDAATEDVHGLHVAAERSLDDGPLSSMQNVHSEDSEGTEGSGPEESPHNLGLRSFNMANLTLWTAVQNKKS